MHRISRHDAIWLVSVPQPIRFARQTHVQRLVLSQIKRTSSLPPDDKGRCSVVGRRELLHGHVRILKPSRPHQPIPGDAPERDAIVRQTLAKSFQQRSNFGLIGSPSIPREGWTVREIPHPLGAQELCCGSAVGA